MTEVDMYLRGVAGNFVSQIVCPYCGVQQDALLEMGWKPQVILCDNEVQGCDKYFTVKIQGYQTTIEYGVILDKDGSYAG